MINTARLCVGVIPQFVSEHTDEFDRDSRVNKNPLVKRYMPATWTKKTQTRNPKRAGAIV